MDVKHQAEAQECSSDTLLFGTSTYFARLPWEWGVVLAPGNGSREGLATARMGCGAAQGKQGAGG